MKMFLVHFNTLQIVFSKANTPAKWPGVMSRNARDYLAQPCPTQMAYWAKNNLSILTRAAHWMTN